MNSFFWGIVGIFAVVYGAANYYVGLRFWQSIRNWLDPAYAAIYLIFMLLLALSPFAARFGGAYFPGRLSGGIALLGDYWLAAIYYLTLVWLVVDIWSGLARWAGWGGADLKSYSFTAAVTALVVLAIIVYGSLNARSPEVRHYEINIAKKAVGLTALHVVMVSDIHLGVVVDGRRLEQMVEMINKLDPDVVFLVGDIIDEDVNRFAEQDMPRILGKIKTKYGVYGVLGNHEYLSGQPDEAIGYLRQGGVVVLRDEVQQVKGGFYLVGRDDRMKLRATGSQRMELAELMAGVDRRLPIIALDHQPLDLEDGQGQGVDLQLSGHTHHGQIFPNGLITRRVFEQDWGYLRKGDFQLIVSDGFGTWGPPIRIGTTPEIVDIRITFGKPE